MSQLPAIEPRKPGESGTPSAQTHMRFDDNTVLAMLFGEHDRNIAQIEHTLGVIIGSRGNELEISGPTEPVGVAEAVLNELYDKLKQGQSVNALVFVGDAMEEDPNVLCKLAGELGILQIPVFIFQDGDDPITERTFRNVARLSSGAWCRFDANSAAQLRDLLCAVAVYAAGGQTALEQFGRKRGGTVLKLSHQIGKKN